MCTVVTIMNSNQPPEMFHKKGVLKNFGKCAGKNSCRNLFLIKRECLYIKKETPTRVSCEFFKIPKNAFFMDNLRAIAFVTAINKHKANLNKNRQ